MPSAIRGHGTARQSRSLSVDAQSYSEQQCRLHCEHIEKYRNDHVRMCDRNKANVMTWHIGWNITAQLNYSVPLRNF